MAAYALLIQVPEHWTEDMAVMLGDRLAEKELPPDVVMALCLPSVDGEGLSPTLKEWTV